MTLAGAGLAVVVGAVFAMLLIAVQKARDAETRPLHSQDALVAANALELRVVDLETRSARLRPHPAQAVPRAQAAGSAEFPHEEKALLELVAAAPAQEADLAMGWRLLAATGMRRGEALALRWRDVDLDAGRVQVRRSIGRVKTKGVGEELVEGPTKTGQARVVEINAVTVAALRAFRATRRYFPLDLSATPRPSSALSAANTASPSGTRAGSSTRLFRRAGRWGGPTVEDPAARPAPHSRHAASGCRRAR
jgi:integrase